jgi:hypothetical protein
VSLDPGDVSVGFDDLDHDGHVAVVLAAQLGALAAEGAGLVGTEPGLVDDARHGVLLDGEVRDPPRVDDVVGGDEQANLGALGHDQRAVDLEQEVFHVERADTGILRSGVDAGAIEAGVERDVLVLVPVMPLPLVGGDYHLGGRYCHHEEDDDGNDRPDDLRRRAVREGRGLHPFRFTVLHERDDHDAEDDDADCHAPPEHHHVQVVGFSAELGDAPGHVETPVGAGCAGPQGTDQAE